MARYRTTGDVDGTVWLSWICNTFEDVSSYFIKSARMLSLEAVSEETGVTIGLKVCR